MRSWIRSTVLLSLMAASVAAPVATVTAQELLPLPDVVVVPKKLPKLNGDMPPDDPKGGVGGAPNTGGPVLDFNAPSPHRLQGPATGNVGGNTGEAGTFIGEEAVVAPSSGHSLTGSDRLHVAGWFNGGYVFNGGSPGSGFNGPYNATDFANQGQFNQSYLIAEYILPRDGSAGVGGRVDALYGSDFFNVQSLGFELDNHGDRRWNSSQYYGVAVPQLYGQVGSDRLNAIVGRWYSLVGYEGVMAAGNFFYSKSYSYQFANPFTHWGALGTYKISDCWQIQGGVHMGWNVLDRDDNNAGAIGGIKYTRDTFWSSFAITSGNEFTNPGGVKGVPNEMANRTQYSFIFDVNPRNGPVEYVLHHFLGWQDEGNRNGGTASWYGLDQYAYYRINDCWKLGARFEWFRDVDGTRVGLNRPANPNNPPLPGNYYSATIGVNWQPMPNLVIRPEARYDWVNDNVARPFNDGSSRNQFMLAVDAVLKF